jgi:nicotinate dehydrogenase subunit A
MAKATFHLHVNGQRQAVTASSETPLLYLLRNDLGLKATRFGCGTGDCGACMVLIDGVAEKSCQTPVESVGDKPIETVEGLGKDADLSVLQQAIVDEQAGQCGYCLSGIIMTATALLRACPAPSEAEVRQALDGNLCRCGSHARIVAAVLRAAAMAAA